MVGERYRGGSEEGVGGELGYGGKEGAGGVVCNAVVLTCRSGVQELVQS